MREWTSDPVKVDLSEALVTEYNPSIIERRGEELTATSRRASLCRLVDLLPTSLPRLIELLLRALWRDPKERQIIPMERELFKGLQGRLFELYPLDLTEKIKKVSSLDQLQRRRTVMGELIQRLCFLKLVQKL